MRRSSSRIGFRRLAAFTLVVATGAPATFAEAKPGDEDVATAYMDMSLESLLRVDVTSVTGAALPWFANPAAVYTITNEDIRRSGHQTLAEVLRMIPGVQVSRVDSRQWAVSARGLDDVFAKELLVLVDGRLVYDPSFAGVWWDIQNMVLEDIERIEVIRGPGATLWGANAVNGVINITTKSAKDTRGLYVTAGVGNEERGFGALRYGSPLGPTTDVRFWAKYRSVDGTRSLDTHADVPDDWDLPQGGFRLDSALSPRTHLTVEGDGYHTEHLGASTKLPIPAYSLDPRNPFPVVEVVNDGSASGANLNTQVEHKTAGGATWTLRTLVEHSHRTLFIETDLQNTIADVDLRHHRKLGRRHELMMGADWRYVHDRTLTGATVGQDPEIGNAHTVSGFLQDTFTIVPQKLTLMAGSKLEHNHYTGFEYQPSGRLAWTPDGHHTFWAAVSRAVRTPARADRDVKVLVGYLDPFLLQTGTPSGIFLPVELHGSPDIFSSSLRAHEAGYRVQLGETFAVDTAVFFNKYHDFIGPGTQITPTATAFRLSFGNQGDGESYGAEAVVNWRPSSRLRTTGSYSYLVLKEDQNAIPHFVRHMANLRSSLRVGTAVELNSGLYYTGQTNTGDALFDAHLRADAGISVRPSSHLEIAAWVQDIGSRGHAEFSSSTVAYRLSEIERSFYAQVTFTH
jgi:iron complex outermembrane recepter protein